MMYSFEKNYKDLPKLLPLFPLKRVLLLPRAKLPLNLFENRYLHMFDFALSNGRTIGIIQPNEKLKSNKDIKNPNLYSVGCAGYITAFSQTNDNRYEIILKGLCRFKVGSELTITKGFRRANVNWTPFKEDFEVKNLKNKDKRKEFMDILRPFLAKISVSADWEAIDVSNDEDIVNSIAMGCPFDESEKQALLEAQTIDDRIEILLSLMKMSLNENRNMASGAVPS